MGVSRSHFMAYRVQGFRIWRVYGFKGILGVPEASILNLGTWTLGVSLQLTIKTLKPKP